MSSLAVHTIVCLVTFMEIKCLLLWNKSYMYCLLILLTYLRVELSMCFSDQWNVYHCIVENETYALVTSMDNKLSVHVALYGKRITGK